VKTLNIATQLAGLLSDASNSSFYPVMFVMVTDELERYGGMLLSRMQTRVEEIAISYQQGAGPSGEFIDLFFCCYFFSSFLSVSCFFDLFSLSIFLCFFVSLFICISIFIVCLNV
jgi:hypothetical protein